VKPPRSAVNRRDLLRLRPLGDRAAQSLRPRGRDVDATWGSGCDLLKATRPGMGSYFEVRLAAGTPGGLTLATAALDLIGELEGQLTVYRADSEVSRLNATAHLGPVEMEPGLFGLLQTAIALTEATAGAYDVTAGALSVAWGFFKGPRRVPDPPTLAEARARTGSHHLRLDPARRTVAFDRPGLVVNLGSIGKGYALDRVAELIRSYWWPTSALVHGGRSSLYALGSPPGRLGGRWEIALRNPLDPDRPLGVVRLRDRGLGTSGAAFQRFEADGRVYGHIIDPRTGVPPADGPASVTVVAPTAAEADALSTALYLLGPDSAAGLLAARPDVGAIFVSEGSPGPGPLVRTLNLTADDFLAAPAAGDWPVFG
jgi:thiamine biosynthesis lipoprotein